MTETADRILALTAEITAAYVGANNVGVTAVSGLIRDIQRALTNPARSRSGDPGKLRPAESRPAARAAVDIRKSVFRDHLVCLEDGKTFKTLARHLGEIHRMTPEQYRAKWGLPESYPMMAPNYAKVRSKIAKEIGLGRRR
jgi:predicted transcriptional regulator